MNNDDNLKEYGIKSKVGEMVPCWFSCTTSCWPPIFYS
jgi:hypothetical protein